MLVPVAAHAGRRHGFGAVAACVRASMRAPGPFGSIAVAVAPVAAHVETEGPYMGAPGPFGSVAAAVAPVAAHVETEGPHMGAEGPYDSQSPSTCLYRTEVPRGVSLDVVVWLHSST